MEKKQSLFNLIVLLVVAGAAIGFFYFQHQLFNKTSHELTEHHGEEEFKRGPHHGRLLEKENFDVEVTIFEPKGVPPRFRIYFYEDGHVVNASDVQFKMELERINHKEIIPFKKFGDYLESEVEAYEPHSFKVNIQATYKDKAYEWEYESYEGRVLLNDEAIKANGIKVEVAGPASLKMNLDVFGKIMPDEEQTVYIGARFPGVVKAVNKKLGDFVKKGDVLAVIESNESLTDYEIKSEMDGTIIKKEINLGMYLSGQENIFVVSNLDSVWADFNIYRKDLPLIKLGNPIEVSSLGRDSSEESTISYIAPFGNESTQSVVVRAILKNSEGQWKPGLFVSGKILLENASLTLAVKQSAVQTFRDWDVVFIAVDHTFEVVPVTLGRRGNDFVEILSGLKPNDRYVSENSYILKADLEKSEAAHEH